MNAESAISAVSAVSETPSTPSREERIASAMSQTDPDGPVTNVRISYRDVSCSMSGEETHRKFVWPGWQVKPLDELLRPQWAEGGRLPALGIRAAERRASVREDVPIGSLLVDYESTIYKGNKSKAKVRIALVVGGDEPCEWLDHRTLRSVEAWEVTVPDGTKRKVYRGR